jgi:hypothetical protein
MSVELAGPLALFAEGAVFFTLQEPETVSKMGYIGKYFAGLFRGWAVAMSTAASLVLLFLPLLFPSTFEDSSAIPASYVWIAAAICFVAANFMFWKRDYKRAEEMASKLGEVESGKPRLLLKQPKAIYCETVTQTFTNQQSGVIIKQRVDTFLKVRFINDPELSVASSKATVIATIDYYRVPDETCVFSLDGRWSESTQPSGIHPLQSKIHLLSATFSQGQQRSLDIAFCDGQTGKYYAWNNDNYNALNEFYVYPAHLLDGERFRIHIRLRGDWVDKHVEFVFSTNNKGFVIESYEEK